MSDNRQCLLFNGAKLKIDCKIFKNTKGLQLHEATRYMLLCKDAVSSWKKKTYRRFQTTHLGFYTNLIPHMKNY